MDSNHIREVTDIIEKCNEHTNKRGPNPFGKEASSKSAGQSSIGVNKAQSSQSLNNE